MRGKKTHDFYVFFNYRDTRFKSYIPSKPTRKINNRWHEDYKTFRVPHTNTHAEQTCTRTWVLYRVTKREKTGIWLFLMWGQLYTTWCHKKWSKIKDLTRSPMVGSRGELTLPAGTPFHIRPFLHVSLSFNFSTLILETATPLVVST